MRGNERFGRVAGREGREAARLWVRGDEAIKGVDLQVNLSVLERANGQRGTNENVGRQSHRLWVSRIRGEATTTVDLHSAEVSHDAPEQGRTIDAPATTSPSGRADGSSVPHRKQLLPSLEAGSRNQAHLRRETGRARRESVGGREGSVGLEDLVRSRRVGSMPDSRRRRRALRCRGSRQRSWMGRNAESGRRAFARRSHAA